MNKLAFIIQLEVPVEVPATEDYADVIHGILSNSDQNKNINVQVESLPVNKAKLYPNAYHWTCPHCDEINERDSKRLYDLCVECGEACLTS